MRTHLTLLLAFLPVCSCSLLGDGPGGEEPASWDSVPHDMIVLGDKLDDPYSMSNVEAALSMLYPTKAGRLGIKATDIYVRFLPKNDDEYDRLVACGINLIDHPLDYEIVRDGDYYHDPSLDEDSITWQYAVLKPDAGYPKDITCEVLDECYIADNDPASRAYDGIDWEQVEREAYRLTGNSSLLVQDTRAGTVSGKPSGRICISDSRSPGGEAEGAAGVRVSCNTFVKFAHAYTDAQGYYQMDRNFTSTLRYRIVFQNEKGFAIGLNKILVPASTSTLGKAGPEGVSITVDKTSDRKLYTRLVVNNSAYEYFESCSSKDGQVAAPPVNTRIWLFQSLDACSTPMLQQGVMIDDTVVGKFLGDYKNLVKMFLPDITLGLKDIDEYCLIYAETVHELAHASHYSNVGKDYWNKYVTYVMRSFVESGGRMYGFGGGENAGYCEVGEMWAYYVQNLLYRQRYGDDSPALGTSYWFYPHILLYLDERGLDSGRIFKALQDDVNSRSSLQDKLGSLYPDFGTIIDQAFERYSD